MRILVTGSDSKEGKALLEAAEWSTNEYIFKDGDDIDLTSKEEIDLDIGCNCYDIIVNCACYYKPAAADCQPDMAYTFNSKVAEYLAEAAKINKCLMIQVTEEMAGASEMYRKTKHLGDEAVERSGCRYIIIHSTEFLYKTEGLSIKESAEAEKIAERYTAKMANDASDPAAKLAVCIVALIDDCLSKRL